MTKPLFFGLAPARFILPAPSGPADQDKGEVGEAKERPMVLTLALTPGDEAVFEGPDFAGVGTVRLTHRRGERRASA